MPDKNPDEYRSFGLSRRVLTEDRLRQVIWKCPRCDKENRDICSEEYCRYLICTGCQSMIFVYF